MNVKTVLMAIILMASINMPVFAAGTQYDIRVDGLACPFCAYGIEKKFSKTEGVNSVDIDIGKGLVIVKTVADKTFSEDELRTIIHDAGFTMKSFTHDTL